MLNRLEKRIIVGAAYVVALLAIGALAVVLPKQQLLGTCFDQIQNQDEVGVDCGGACPSCLPPEETLLQKIDVKWARAFRQKQGVYDLASLIENKNYIYGGEEVEYVFRILDSSGKEAQTVSGKTYILPHGSRYIVRQGVALAPTPAQISLEVTSVNWKKITGYISSGLSVEDKKLEFPSGSPNVFASMSGAVSNVSPYDLRSIDVDMIVFDASGDPIAANHSEMQTVQSGQKRAFTVFWPTPFEGRQVARNFDISVNSNFFLPDNFIKSQ